MKTFSGFAAAENDEQKSDDAATIGRRRFMRHLNVTIRRSR
jgi:hypothetical protein